MRALRAQGTNGLLVASAALVLGASVLLATLVPHPPPLGWVGLGAVWAIVFGIVAVAKLVFPHLRVNPPQPAAPIDDKPRLLVVADEHCGSPALWQEIHARLAGAVAVHLVVPVRVSHLHYLTNDESDESRDADERAHLAIDLLRQHGVSVSGGVGSDDPLESMTDALASFPATRVLLATSGEEDSYWMERGLLASARALTPLDVSQLIVPPTPRALDHA